MTEHLADDVLARLARPGDDAPEHRRHLEGCPDCLTRAAAWQEIGSALRAEAARSAASVPSFDALLGPALAASGPLDAAGRLSTAADTPTPERRRHAFGLPHPWRTAWQLAVRQIVLMPGIWAPLNAAGFLGATVLASTYVQERFAVRLFGAVVVLLVMFGALMAASPRRDPKREVLFTLPVPPAAVFLARLTVVLCADVAMAMACSALLDGPGWWAVVSSWLGESLLAASLALALAVRFSPAQGAAAGGAVWLLGVVSGPEGMFSTPADTLVNALLSTTPWTLVLTVALLAWAAGAMRSFRLTTVPQ
ncbi:hypothetical protein [Streptomyces sp. SID5643]|uniref:hypothetical protein n=1 Tax=Streptomyces sp. SID5643 TaxID=2690307 RepID=UPI001368F4E7|nr:hypothetical protein [Streptomyces sp. SID5643]MZF87642.1 hypothetical protein [Streptomyces sp. SID5643]